MNADISADISTNSADISAIGANSAVPMELISAIMIMMSVLIMSLISVPRVVSRKKKGGKTGPGFCKTRENLEWLDFIGKFWKDSVF